ncbi:hypothetical protein H7200_00500 [Candidatus Saccharibacteria bacterium]|nr:hypothetical protein [Candidatus Saccharibacteria bacterium]
MDNRQFGESYRPLSEKKPPSNPERREVLEAPRKWMHFFGETMQNYLVGKQPPDINDFMTKIGEYYDWSHTFLDSSMQTAQHIDDPLSESDIMNEFTFHQINGPVAYLWSSLLYSKHNIFPPDQIADMQAELAVSMAQPSRRLKILDQNRTITTNKEYSRLKGGASEVDGMIALMELMKKYPHVIVLPAPEIFEHNKRSSDRSADLLVIDTVDRQVIGAQIKTNTVDIFKKAVDPLDINAIPPKKEKPFDTNYVIVIDSAYELGNTVFSPRSREARESLPGQIAMGLLSTRPVNKPPVAVPRLHYLKSRQIAVELSRGRKSFLGQAVHHLEERIMPKLEKEGDADQQTA